MPLTDEGKETLQEAYMEFTGTMEGLLDELDRLATADEGEDFDIMDEVIDLIRQAVDNFDEDLGEIYETEYMDEEELDDDVDFDNEL